MRLLYFLFVYPLSRLPFPVLYFISDLLYLLIYYVIGYRWKVVHCNLKESFPEKSAEYLLEVERKFYSHFCDLMVESLKLFTIGEEAANKRISYRNPEIFSPYFIRDKGVIMAGGHYGNWEMFAVTVAAHVKHVIVALYKPLSNKFFNRLIEDSRTQFGLKLLPATEIKSQITSIKEEPRIFVFGIDQSPRKNQKAYWMEFLNQETGVQFGAEKYAVKYDLPVVFANVFKIRRGYYEVVFSLVTDSPRNTQHGEITEAVTRKLEEVIVEQPEYWLWSHRRWKHEKPTEEMFNDCSNQLKKG